MRGSMAIFGLVNCAYASDCSRSNGKAHANTQMHKHNFSTTSALIFTVQSDSTA